MSRTRRTILIAHRWVGLTVSAVLGIVGVTGAVLAWPVPSLIARAAVRLHVNLALGPAGRWVVLAASLAGIALQLSGLYLWWKGRSLRVRANQGWNLLCFDLHHAAG